MSLSETFQLLNKVKLTCLGAFGGREKTKIHLTILDKSEHSLSMENRSLQ